MIMIKVFMMAMILSIVVMVNADDDEYEHECIILLVVITYLIAFMLIGILKAGKGEMKRWHDLEQQQRYVTI